MMHINDALHLVSMLMIHYLLCIRKGQLRGRSITLDSNIGRCFEMFHSLNHSNLLLQDILIRDVHNVLKGFGKNLSQLGSEKLSRLCKF